MNREDLDNSLKRLVWVGALFLGAALVISAVERRHSSRIEALEIDVVPMEDGSNLVKSEDILNSISRTIGLRLDGMPIGGLDVARVERMLEKDPLILDADVFIDARNNLHVRVLQRQPLMRVIDKNGLSYYLDKDGIKMPLSPHFSSRVIVASGYIPPHVPDFMERKRHTLKSLFLLAHDIVGDPFLSAMIGQLYVNNQGEIVMAPIIGDQKILFGGYQDAAEKLRNLKIFYKEALPYEGWRKYEFIDLRFRGQVVGR
ncbi:MAG: cell division protein FtsQ/DivIB [Saprospiraceae bacterium]|jgi:cell division protein FtsQ